METGALTATLDVAQLVLYAFWIFFAGLIYYLARENHREGYPMETGRADGPRIGGWPVPSPKTYRLHDGGTVQAPDFARRDGSYQAKPTQGFGGTPIEPLGDPLLAGVGPGGWAARADVPDLHEGHPKIVPLRFAGDCGVAARDIDPRGLPVIGADGAQAGEVSDLWIDRTEMMFRYLEVRLPAGSRVLLPICFARIRRDAVAVHAIEAGQFQNVPRTAQADRVTFLEEEKVSAYYGAGLLYARPERQEPLL